MPDTTAEPDLPFPSDPAPRRESRASFGLMLAGTVFVILGMSQRLITYDFQPPGGSEVLWGGRIMSFSGGLTGWNFASLAGYSHIRDAVLLLFAVTALRIGVHVASVFRNLDLTKAKLGLRFFHAALYAVVSVGWLLLMGLIFGAASLFPAIVRTGMPKGGEQGLITAFAQFSHSPTQPTEHLSLGLGIGWFLVVGGLIVSFLSVLDVAGRALLIYGAILVVAYGLRYFVDVPEIQRWTDFAIHRLTAPTVWHLGE